MTFHSANFRLVSAGDNNSNSGNIKNSWSYVSYPDTLTDVETANYFNPVFHLLKVGDKIIVYPELITADEIGSFTVMSNSNGIVVVARDSIGNDINGNQVVGRNPLKLGLPQMIPGILSNLMVYIDNTQNPFLPQNFTDSYFIKDARMVAWSLFVVDVTFTININGDELCSFALSSTPGVNDPGKMVYPINDTLTIGKRFVSSSDELSWSSDDPGSLGSAILFLDLVRYAPST